MTFFICYCNKICDIVFFIFLRTQSFTSLKDMLLKTLQLAGVLMEHFLEGISLLKALVR